MVSWTRDRILAMGSLIAVIALSWLYLARMNMSRNGGGIIYMAMPGMAGAPLEQFTAAFLIWTVMMVAMMLPTAVRAIDVFGSFARKRTSAIGSAPATSLFVLGYVAVWTAYSVVAAAGQVALSRASLLAPTLQSTSVVLSVALLLVAGTFQFTSFKDACLTQCRSPFPFFLAKWRDGDLSAFVLGMQHGSYCVGCCWALMGLMFVFGAMNLLWMGALSLFMLGEKIAPASRHLNRGAGVVLILWGIFLATRLLG
jgi:predicted metal-binding membrane protein